MSQIAISKSLREFLIRHMVKVEDEKEDILKEFYPKVTIESIEFEELIKNYIISIEEFIKKAQIGDNDPINVPFVLIESIVEIQDLYDQTVETFQIISPFSNQCQTNYPLASYLSPIGKALLLKKKGDKVDIKIPTGYSHYLIKDIKYSLE